MGILIADDHDLVREMIAAYLEGEGLGPVQTVANLGEAETAVKARGPFDLVLIDYEMPGMNGLDGLKRMIELSRGKPVALMSGVVPASIAETALRIGAAGYVPKTLGSRSLAAAARVMIGGNSFAPVALMRVEEGARNTLLSPREMDVLRGVSAGKSNKEIAREHDLQEVTVKLHVKTMSRKLGAKNRTHAAMIARDRRLV